MPEMLDFTLASFEEMALALGQRLKALRLAHGWQQTELARRAGVSRHAVQVLEGGGQGSLLVVLRLAQALGRESELQDLFALKVQSIAQMDAAARAPRQRAPRKPGRVAGTPNQTTP